VKTLRDWRTDKLMSVRALAEAAGVQHKTIIQIEYGRQQPHYGTMRRIADALGVAPAEITEFAAVLEDRKKDAA
jgi:transcriptional regulator with XRE-family HTH domain